MADTVLQGATMYKLMPSDPDNDPNGDALRAAAVQWYVSRGWHEVTVEGVMPQGGYVMVTLRGLQPSPPRAGALADNLAESMSRRKRKEAR